MAVDEFVKPFEGVLLDFYWDGRFFSLNNNVKMELKDVLISEFRVVTLGFQPKVINKPMFKDRFLPDITQVTYEEINQSC